MAKRKLALLLGLLASVAAIAATTAMAGSAPVEPQLIDDSQLTASTATMGGADVLPTTRTIAHWYGTTTNPTNGVTYGYNMVGSDPNHCSGSDCTTTIQADITPIIVHFDGYTWDGTSKLNAVLNSPVFQNNDYGATSAATIPSCGPGTGLCKGPGGALSQLDSGVPLQLEDATMRAQFNKTGGASNYHVILQPNVMPAVTIDVPQNQGGLLVSGRGVVFPSISISWWSGQIQNLEQSADPTHLPIYLTDNVMLHVGNSIFNCCVLGYHGTRAAGNGGGSNNSNGNAVVQTFAWASWVRPGLYSRPNGGTDWALQDIHALSHEIAEWGDDPFVNNSVQPWLTPTAPQYGCSGLMETGDPVVAIGFSEGTNTYDQTPNPWTSPTNHTPSVSYDGTYHPEDEVFLPWFMRTPANQAGSEPTQSGTGGRYTLMGDLNPFSGFGQPATGC